MDDRMGNGRTFQCHRPVHTEIKAVRKSGIFTDYEVCKYIRMENGYSADIFNLDIIIAVAYRVNTFYAHAFRKWLKEKAVSENKQEQKSVFILLDKRHFC